MVNFSKPNIVTMSFANLFKNDPILRALNDDKVLWGDLMLDLEEGPVAVPYKRQTRKSKSKSPSPKALSYHSSNMLKGFKTPDLRLRKGIYENFPVVVNDLGDGVYEIKWHKKNLEDWRKERAMSWDEFQEYELFCEYRLVHSLRKHADRYELMPTTNKDQIVRFKMIMAEAAFRGPKLMRLNDIKTHFPVVWHKVDGRAGETTYAIEVRGDFMRKASKAEAAAMREALLEALRASRAWAVLAAKTEDGAAVCRIEMKHE